MMTWVDEVLATLKNSRLERSVRLPDAGRVAWGSNDYLGLSWNPLVQEAARAAINRYGTGARASRLIEGHTPAHAALEASLATFMGREAALVFPSGYMANLAVVGALVGEGDAVVIDRLCHASLVDA